MELGVNIALVMVFAVPAAILGSYRYLPTLEMFGSCRYFSILRKLAS